MITRKQSIEQFSLRMDEIISTNYILADKKISNMLKTVTVSKLFYDLISYCADGFDYREFCDAVPEGEPFPTDNKKHLIAFGFSLLTNLDCKEEDFLSMLKKHYPADKFEQSYRMFCVRLLTPFKLATIDAVTELDREITNAAFNEEAENEGEKETDKKSKGKKKDGEGEQIPIDIPAGSFVKSRILDNRDAGKNPHKKYLTCYKDIQKIIGSENEKIMHSKFLKEKDKEDLCMLLEQFKNCLFSGGKEEIRTSFISYKYAALAFKKLESEVEDIERILKFCDAI